MNGGDIILGVAVVMSCVVLPILLLADMVTYLFRTRDFSGNDGGACDSSRMKH